MIGHGAIVALIGLAAGFGLLMSLIGGIELIPGHIIAFDLPGDSRAWARAHAGGLMNGMLVFVGALLIHSMRIAERPAWHLNWMLVGTGYANTIFYWGGLFAPNHALTIADNRLGDANWAAIVGLVPAIVFAFVTMLAMLIFAFQAFAPSEQN